MGSVLVLLAVARKDNRQQQQSRLETFKGVGSHFDNLLDKII